MLVCKELVEFLLSLGKELSDLFGWSVGVGGGGRTDSGSDHGLELLLFLNFVSVISN